MPAILIASAALLFVFIFYPPKPSFLGNFLGEVALVLSGPDSSLTRVATSYQALFSSKESLVEENKLLTESLKQARAEIMDKEDLAIENENLKNILGRASSRKLVLASVLLHPPRSPYDTILVDAGATEGITIGSLVFAYGDFPVGSIEEVHTETSLVRLYTSSGKTLEVSIGGTTALVKGSGGGAFEALIPRDIALSEGDLVYFSQGRIPMGEVAGVLSDPRDPFQKILINSKVSLFDIRQVEIEKK